MKFRNRTNQGEQKHIKEIVQLNMQAIRTELKELVQLSVEEVLNILLDAEADRLTNAQKYERTGGGQDTTRASY